MIYEIPIDSMYPYFVQTTSIENVAYQIEFFWNDRDERWRFSLLDMQENCLIRNVKIVPYLPMVSRYKIPNLFKGDFVGIDAKNNGSVPTRNNLGSDFKLYYFPLDELQNYGLDKLL